MKTEISFMLIFSLIQDGNFLNLNVKPTNIEPGTTENLLVNCSLFAERTPGLAFLNSLTLSRSIDMNRSEYPVVASISTVGGRVNVYDEDAVGSGVVSNKGESYLCLQWANPGSEMAGSYVCEANGRLMSWRPQTYTVVAEITSSVIYQNSILEQLKISRLENIERINEINNLNERISALEDNDTISTNLINKLIDENKAIENNVITSTNFINKLKDENKVELKTLFFESSVFNGRRYCLPKECAFVTYTSAQVTCAKYGGHLAEIDDDSEFNFVRNFLTEKSSYSTVMISGSDSGHEGYWTHARNNTEIKYIKWVSISLRREPDGGTNQNCLCLCSFCDWYFGDTLCVAYNSDKTFNFLCEIPQQ